MKNKFILRILYSLSLTIIFCSHVIGQTSFLSNPNDVTIKSPETSSLLLFNKIPVGSFTGTPNISIPIYKIVGKSINVPISIDYNVNSLQVENHPTCLGMGWALTAGGSISRIVRRIQDEYLDTRKGFYYNCDNFSGENWNQYRGVSGENVYIHDCEADIFMFNFLGMSGEFFLDNDKKWKVRSDDNIKVECKIEENLIDPGYVFKAYSTVPTIRNFTLTDKYGNKYFFGGDTTNIEFNMPAFNNGSFAAMSWKLSRIISADKVDTISFNYERGPYTCSISKNKDSTYINIINNTPYPNNYVMDWNESINFFAPLYLKSIKVNGKETIDLDYDISTHYQHSRQDFDVYFFKKSGNTYASIPNNYTISYHRNFEIFKRKNISINYPTDMIRELKLTDIIIYNEESRVHQKINFKFNSDTTERLFLEEVDFKGREDNYRSALDYKIYYNNKHLFPKYNNIISDHWGYNNNRPYGMLKNIKYDKSINSFYSKIGVLDSIVLPTGGKNVYIFENHDYGKALDSLNTINILNKSGFASGLRIKKIDAYYKNQYYGGKEYIYKRNPLFESNPVSSGVLQSYPYYFSRLNNKSEENGEFIFSVFEMTSSPFIPLSDIAGRHSVTYSEVTEKNIDKLGNAIGYVTFKFSNYDNGYNDDREGVLGYNRDFVNMILSIIEDLKEGEFSKRWFIIRISILLKKTYTNGQELILSFILAIIII
ncbi:hypothetical protein SDC9_47240 [bioreactor metagenome]|uniref:Uncharacterized protein n=1 Tax=bioreactor metagenome TaxID=1076179 RepID=A0A644WEQ0_9ZZZZ